MPHGGVSVYFMSSDGAQWAKYIEDKLTSQQYGIVTHLNKFTDRLDNHTKSLYLNVFVITPDFLDLLDWSLMNDFDKSSAMLVLTGVEKDELAATARALKCPDIMFWPYYQLRGTEQSVRDLMISIIKAYETVHDYDRVPSAPRQVNHLQSVEFKNGRIEVRLEKVAESCVNVLIEDMQPAEDGSPFYVFPGGEDNKVSVFLNTHSIGIGHIGNAKPEEECQNTASNHVSIGTQTDFKVDLKELKDEPSVASDENIHYTEKTENLIHESDMDPDSLINNESEINDKLKGESEQEAVLRKGPKKQSKLELLHALLEDETQPTRILCQCLGIEEGGSVDLDEKMTSLVTCSETLKHLSFPPGQSDENVHTDINQPIWPTLLHFGARYNLLMFCDALLSNPLMYSACLKRNKDGLLPHDIARQNQHNELAKLLEHFTAFVLAEKDRLAGKSLSSRVKYDSGFSGTPRLSTMVHPYVPEHGSADPHEYSPPHGNMALQYKDIVNALGSNLNFTFSDEDDASQEFKKDIDGNKVKRSSLPEVPERKPLADDHLIPPGGGNRGGSPKHFHEKAPTDHQDPSMPDKSAAETEKKKGLFSKIFKTKRKTRRGSVPEISIDHSTFKHTKSFQIPTESQRSSTSSTDSFTGRTVLEVLQTDGPPPRPAKPTRSMTLIQDYQPESSWTGSKSIVEESANAEPAVVEDKDDVELPVPCSFHGNSWERKSMRLQFAKEDRNLTGPPLPCRRPKEKL